MRFITQILCKLGLHWFEQYLLYWSDATMVWICSNCAKAISTWSNFAYAETRFMSKDELKQYCLRIAEEHNTAPNLVLEKWNPFPHPLPHILMLMAFLNKFSEGTFYYDFKK